MKVIGFHASHEQYAPSELLSFAKRAEYAGFSAASCSDHFHPWSELGTQSGFAWSWLGSALEATRMTFGVVNAPGQRYHPAIIAQAVATLCEMYPGRFWLAVGSGENLNEHITGDSWPAKKDRNRRLKEAVDVMRALWAGETVTHHGAFICDNARLFTRPSIVPKVFGAALTPETAKFLGGFADGLITAGKEHKDLDRVLTAFREGGGEGKPAYLQVALAYAETDDQALESIHGQWRVSSLKPPELADIKTPKLFDQATSSVSREMLRENFRVSSSWQKHLEWLTADFDLGFSAVYLNLIGGDVVRFIDVFGEHVLPLALEA